MKNLKAFLNPVKVEIEEVEVSKRFIDEKGEIIKFQIKPLTQEENDRIQKKHMKKDKKGQVSFNQTDYMNDLVAESIVYPELDDAELQQAYGAFTKTEVLKKMLLAGEYMNLMIKVQEISDLMTTEDELIEEAKN